MRLKYKNTMTLARAVKDYLHSEKNKFSARPYNRHKPDNCLWWVVPSTDWPSYKHGKYVFWSNNNEIYAGIHIEKGLDKSLSMLYPSKKGKTLMMNDQWIWFSFMNFLRSGKVEEIVREMFQKNNRSVEFSIQAGIVSDVEQYDPNSPKPDSLKFNYDENGLYLAEEKLNINAINSIKEMKCLSELPDLLQGLKDLNWLWIDIFIVSPFDICEDDETCNKIVEVDLIDKYLNPLKILIR